MFLGDSVITPAISVLSAVEGLKLATPAFEHIVVGLTVAILVGLFAVAKPRHCQGRRVLRTDHGGLVRRHRDRRRWCISATIRTCWPRSIRSTACVFLPITARSAWSRSALVFLAVTGGEALYADLGHFGRKPIQTAWLFLVLPALVINYFGQGAMVLADPAAIENPFYRLVPETFLLPMVVLATAATVIASQAVITGAYSLVHQAIQLGLLPRLAILHTSASACRPDLHSARDRGAAGSACCCWSACSAPQARSPPPMALPSPPPWWWTECSAFIVIWKTVAMAAMAGGAADGAVRRCRRHLLLRQFPQDFRGRLGAARSSAPPWCC